MRPEPPRMIAPPSNEELRREMMRPEPPRMIAPPSNEELRREMMRPDGIIEYRHGFSPALAEMQRRQRELEREVFYGGPRQPRMQAPCPCPACRPSDGDAKSLALLKQWLSPSQLAQYERDRFFDVTGSTSGKRYRIRTDRQQNVYRLEGGREMHGLCFVPDPEQTRAVGDVMLAQKIALETDEAEALKVAQAFPVFGAQSLF
jgi:hypothetical protein